MYNPYNPNNCLFKTKDIQQIVNNSAFTVRNNLLFQTAMVHSSYVRRQVYTTPQGQVTQLVNRPSDCLELFDESYERLEHLGDSVLGNIVSSYLFKRFPHENEGFLTDLKKELVCNETLGKLSLKINLNKFFIISRHNEEACNGRENLKKLGDILEAFIGALWVDTDHNFAILYKFVIHLIESHINIPRILLNNRNYKEQFQRLYQAKYKTTPTYKMISNNNSEFEMIVVDEKETILGKGISATKKQAEQLAAKMAMKHPDFILQLQNE